jgi:hypothetical protein
VRLPIDASTNKTFFTFSSTRYKSKSRHYTLHNEYEIPQKCQNDPCENRPTCTFYHSDQQIPIEGVAEQECYLNRTTSSFQLVQQQDTDIKWRTTSTTDDKYVLLVM